MNSVLSALCTLSALAGAAAAAEPPTCDSCTYSVPEFCQIVSQEVSCGASQAISFTRELSLEVSADCFGASVTIGGSASVTVEMTLDSGDCETCWLEACFPHATMTVRKCTRRVPAEWDCDDVAVCGFRRCRVLSWRTETYYTKTLNAGTANITKKCRDDSERCTRAHPHRPCNGGEKTTPNTEVPAGSWELLWPLGSTILAFDVTQFAPMEDGPEAGDLAELSVSRLTTLRWAIDDALAQTGAQESDAAVTLTFAGGKSAAATYAQVKEAIDETITAKRASGEVYDFNGDGTLDLWDLADFTEAVKVASQGALWPSRADVNADGQLDTEDECEITTVVLSEL